MYYKLAFKKKRSHSIAISALIGLLLVVIGGALIFQNITLPKESHLTTVEKYELGNITAASAAIFWQTRDAVPSAVRFGTDPSNLTSVESDLRDVSTSPDSRKNHYVELTELKQNTTYYFQFVSDDQVLGENNVVYQLLTAQSQHTTSNLSPLYGKIVSPNDQPVEGSIVILKTEKIAPLLAVTKRDGTFLFSLCCMVDKHSRPVGSLSEKEKVDITVVDPTGTVLVYKTYLSSLMGQTVTLALQQGDKTIDERKNDTVATDVVPVSPTLSVEKNVLGTSVKDSFSILYPKEGSIIPGSKPLFKGIASPGAQLSLTIQSKLNKKIPGLPIVTSIVSDERGIWTYTPDALLADTYTVQVSVKTGRETSKRSTSFTVAKSGESVLGDATGSATLTPTAVLTEAPTSTPSATITATQSATTTPRPTAPVTGFNMGPILFTSAALILVGCGFLIFF